MSTSTEILHHLEQATADLLFPSESDFPVVPFLWPTAAPSPDSPTNFLATRNYGPDTPIETLDFEAFFVPKSQHKDWQDDQQRATAKRIGELAQVLSSNLTNLRVYKVGRINFDVFALGQAPDGNWLGVSTQVVET